MPSTLSRTRTRGFDRLLKQIVLAPHLAHIVLEHLPDRTAVGRAQGALNPARDHVGRPEIGVAEGDVNGPVVVLAGKVGSAHQAADDASRIETGMAIDALEREAGEQDLILF